MTMSGKTNKGRTFEGLFEAQKTNQNTMLSEGMYDGYLSEVPVTLPVDDVTLCSYHVQQLVSEIGEVLEADKRWKNFRNVEYRKEDKLNEIADCFIVLMNIAMFSGFSGEDIAEAVSNKIDIVKQRIASKS